MVFTKQRAVVWVLSTSLGMELEPAKMDQMPPPLHINSTQWPSSADCTPTDTWEVQSKVHFF